MRNLIAAREEVVFIIGASANGVFKHHGSYLNERTPCMLHFRASTAECATGCPLKSACTRPKDASIALVSLIPPGRAPCKCSTLL